MFSNSSKIYISVADILVVSNIEQNRGLERIDTFIKTIWRIQKEKKGKETHSSIICSGILLWRFRPFESFRDWTCYSSRSPQLASWRCKAAARQWNPETKERSLSWAIWCILLSQYDEGNFPGRDVCRGNVVDFGPKNVAYSPALLPMNAAWRRM